MIFNSHNRTNLDNVYTTIKFKSVFPDYTTWKDNLTSFGIDLVDIKEADFNFLQTMIGNAHLMYRTDVKNKGKTAFVFKDELYKMKKRLEFTNKSLDEMIKSTSLNEFTLFTIDRTLAGDADPSYIDNKTKSEITNTIPLIDRLNELKELTNLKNPEILFLINVANRILLPLQPEQINKEVL